ncbi:MAG: acylphosphatase, partial [Draconibacterium sp.]|nr:acylphosphatase [Draconibacterium sp.]
MSTNSEKNIRIQIRGLVQGVGFRPFVYRTAIKNNISGYVKNSTGAPIEDVTLTFAGIDINTTATGFYNFSVTVTPGIYNMI